MVPWIKALGNRGLTAHNPRTMQSVEIQTPAKINLFLRVLGRRPDGYHDLESLMIPVSLYDRVKIERVGQGLQVECPGQPALDGGANLAHAAARAWLHQQGRPESGYRITIVKKIPIQAGLGGGSSDAAAVLQGLQALNKKPLSDKILHDLATDLGADVPFFLMNGPCLARGIGERLSPAGDLPRIWLILARAPFGLETRRVFETLKYPLTSLGDDDSHNRSQKWGFTRLADALSNDLQPIGERLHPVIRRVRQELSKAGAAGALMSGSGPSVFGLFRTRHAARQTLRRMRRTKGWTYLVLRAVSWDDNKGEKRVV
jgi:4-diphosphocytidyl-2-C-methyl-D-erythritol kinase